MLKRSFNPDLSGKTKTFIILIFSIFLSSISFALDSLEVIMTFEIPEEEGQFLVWNKNKSGGDLNNDGYDDYIHSFWNYQTEQREFLFYFGSANPDSIPDLEFISHPCANRPSWGGDLNGDGYKDIVYSVITGPFDGGDIYICLGGDSIDIEPELIFYGENYAPDPCGLEFWGINGGYDFNGDGYDDILAGGIGPDYFWNGQVDLFFGGEEIDNVTDFHIQGEPLEEFGKYKTAGDINGDGYDELIASRNIDIEGPLKFEIYLGGPNMDTVMDYEIPEIYYGGICIANGDLNGDGYDDLIIGVGNIYIYFGNPESNLVCDSIDVSYGITKVFYCNLNNDIYEDLVAFRYISNNENYIYIYFGKENFDTSSNPDIITNLIGTYHFSPDNYCSNIGDFDGDGKNEIVISNGSPYNTATVYTLAGGQNIDDNYDLLITNDELMRVYPNPFVNSTTIYFFLEHPSHVNLTIYNIKGQKVRMVENGKLKKGYCKIFWDGRDDKGHCLPLGIYFAKMKTEKGVNVVKMVKIGR